MGLMIRNSILLHEGLLGPLVHLCPFGPLVPAWASLGPVGLVGPNPVYTHFITRR
jgi:hypothetical protein